MKFKNKYPPSPFIVVSIGLECGQSFNEDNIMGLARHPPQNGCA